MVRRSPLWLEDLLGLQTMENSRLEAAAGPARESVEAVLQFIQQQIEMVRLQIHIHIDQHPDLKSQKELLSSIPGIGDNIAVTLLAFGVLKSEHPFDPSFGVA